MSTAIRPSVGADDEFYWDYESPGSKVRLDLEAAYRRGYQQGAFIAADAIRRGALLSAVMDWASIRLHSWRYGWRKPGWTRNRPVKVVAPPDPPYPKGRELS